MSDPPQPTMSGVISGAMRPTWNGIEWGGTGTPFTIRLLEKGPPHLQFEEP